MAYVRPKKRLGQHFLKDSNIANDIVDALCNDAAIPRVLEIGPGTGVLSDFLVIKPNIDELVLMDLDEESIAFLKAKYSSDQAKVQHGDFLKTDFDTLFDKQSFNIIGNFPYNISSQIFFKILENRDRVIKITGMLQKEVAERIAAKEGSKTYGILSVLLSAYYDIEYLFTVPPHVFDPPPKVQSGVITLLRNDVQDLGCDEVLFKRVVKAGFQMRRKTLRNALKPLNLSPSLLSMEMMDKRAEQLSVQDYIALTRLIQEQL